MQKKSRILFDRIENILKHENLNIKVSTKVILTGVAVYGEILHAAKKNTLH